MISHLRRILTLLFLLGMGLLANATHLIGGYFQYKLIDTLPGNTINYELTLYLYVDCGPNSNIIFEDAAFTIFDGNNNFEVLSTTMPLFADSIIPDDINNPCVVSGPNICVKEEIYKTNIFLTRDRPHTITYQRCCRNGSIDNLNFPDQQGSTITTFIPEYNAVGSNDSPVFNEFPPISICSGFDVNLDLSANDPDGDSLVYALCSPLNYPDQSNVRPIPADPPPYFNVPFSAGFSPTNPLPANPALSINPQTGLLSGVPTNIGQYVMAYCVEEYRNGALIGLTRRAIQVNTGNCNPVITSAIQDQTQFCDGDTVQFTNNSTGNVNIQGYKWDFGDPTTLADTSRDFEPFYVYPAKGTYTITLITNPDLPCNDTNMTDFDVFPKLEPQLDFEGQICIDDNSIDFVARGRYENYATLAWNFGSNANIGSSNQDSVPGVKFQGSGPFPVQLIVSQDGCSDTLNDQVVLFPNPVANFTYSPGAGCYPLPVQFNNLSTFTSQPIFSWDFGDGNTSSQANPVHTYTANGYYDVSLELRTTSECIDTVQLVVDSAVHISLDSSKNKIDFGVSPSEICPGTEVFFLDSTFYEGGADYFWDFGNNQFSTDPIASFTYTDTGYYSVGLLLIVKDKCVDTLQLTLDSAIRVLPEPISVLEIVESEKPVKEADFVLDARNSQFYTQSDLYLNQSFLASTDYLEYSIRDTGHYRVRHVATNSFGCTDTTYKTLFVFDEYEFEIPNVFTPNGDFINDEFKVRACGVYDYEIQIWNRYGTEVFYSNSMSRNWDGRIQGKAVNSGTFFYKIRIKDFRGEFREFTGPITLLRD